MKPPYICKYCGCWSYIEPSDQSPPVDHCDEVDHGDWAEICARLAELGAQYPEYEDEYNS